VLRSRLPRGGGRSLTRGPYRPATTCAILTGDAGVSRSGYERVDVANEETVEDRFLKGLYGLTDGQATRVVREEELARRLGMDPDGETDKARFLGDGAAP
jgi:hypothetical protein